MAPPAAAYAHGIHIPAGFEVVVTSGVVPTRKDGSVPSAIADQANTVWQNISSILNEGGMTLSDVVSVTTYVVHSANLEQNLKLVMAARDAALKGHRAASTLVTVPALAKPEWLMEISVLAAKQPNS